MSTMHITGEPCTLPEFIAAASEIGWQTVQTEADAGEVDLGVSKGEDTAWGVVEVQTQAGAIHVAFMRYGRNDLWELEEHLGTVDEHSEEFGLLLNDPELDEDDLDDPDLDQNE